MVLFPLKPKGSKSLRHTGKRLKTEGKENQTAIYKKNLKKIKSWKRERKGPLQDYPFWTLHHVKGQGESSLFFMFFSFGKIANRNLASWDLMR